MNKVFVFDPTISDRQSAIRGIGRYLQILKENFPNWTFTNKIGNWKLEIGNYVFINPFFNFFQPPLIMRKIAQKQIAIIHDLIALKYPTHFPIGIKGNINVYLNKLALKNYDLIVTDSQASKSDIIKMIGIDENKIKVIYPCLPKIFSNQLNQSESVKSVNTEIKPIQPITDSTDYCLYVGDATWNKNLVNLAKAIKIVNVPCIFVGKIFNTAVGVASEVTLREADCEVASRASQERRDHERQNLPREINPWQKELKDFFGLAKNDKRFIFPGFIDDCKLFKLYKQAKVNILVSRDEGFGFSYLEAANLSCPSVLSNISVLKEIADDSASFTDPNNPQDIANKIKEIHSNDDLRNNLGFRAQQRASFFSNKSFVLAWERIIFN